MLIVLVVIVAAAAVGGTVALSAPALMAKFGAAKPAYVPPAPRLVLGGLSPTAPTPSSTALATALEKPLDAIPGKVTGVVLDAQSGTVLWDHTSERALVPGSTGKLLTAAAALLTLDPTDAFVTKAVAGTEPGTVVLVGGGDPTLTALPEGKEGVYTDPARLVDLAKKVKATAKAPITKVLVDTSRYTGPTMAPGWESTDIAGGYITPMEPLMLDGGRVDPTEQDGARVANPAITAGKAFAQLLGVDPDTVKATTTGADAATLGAVSSAPITELVENALRASDNVLAEALARQVAIARGGDPSFAGAAKEVVAALTQSGIDTSGAAIVDGSGLSTEDRVPARVLGAVLAAAAAPAKAPSDVEFLRPILTGLPVAGGDGTLEDRFGTDSGATQGRGVVRAKTGTLTDVSTLAGVVTDTDGRLLVFALMSNGGLPSTVRPRLDDVAATLSQCGCRY